MKIVTEEDLEAEDEQRAQQREQNEQPRRRSNRKRKGPGDDDDDEDDDDDDDEDEENITCRDISDSECKSALRYIRTDKPGRYVPVKTFDEELETDAQALIDSTSNPISQVAIDKLQEHTGDISTDINPEKRILVYVPHSVPSNGKIKPLNLKVFQPNHAVSPNYAQPYAEKQDSYMSSILLKERDMSTKKYHYAPPHRNFTDVFERETNCEYKDERKTCKNLKRESVVILKKRYFALWHRDAEDEFIYTTKKKRKKNPNYMKTYQANDDEFYEQCQDFGDLMYAIVGLTEKQVTTIIGTKIGRAHV